MNTLEERVDVLEGIIHRCGLDQTTGYFPGTVRWRLCDKDGDGDMDPLTSTSWDGDSFSTSTGTINWNTAFGVPPGARAVFVRGLARDAASNAGSYYMTLKTRAATTVAPLTLYTDFAKADMVVPVSGIVGISPAGTSYYSVVASGGGTFDVWMYVVAYAT